MAGYASLNWFVQLPFSSEQTGARANSSQPTEISPEPDSVPLIALHIPAFCHKLAARENHTMTLVHSHVHKIKKTGTSQGIWEQFLQVYSRPLFFYLLCFWTGGEEGTFIEGQCGADGAPHKLRSSVLAGRDNYTAVWYKMCTEADSSYTTYSNRAIWLFEQSAQIDREQWQSNVPQGHCTKKYCNYFL